MQTTNNNAELFGDVIHSYTRAQSIADGMLVDVSATAREAGIVWSVARTSAAWSDCVAWSDADEKRKGGTGQSESGRLWDVCWVLSLAARGALRRGLDMTSPLTFKLLRTPREGRGGKPRLVRLKFVAGPGDDGRPVITVLLPAED